MSRGRRIFFFASKTDFVKIFDEEVFKDSYALKFIEFTNYETSKVPYYNSVKEIPNIGFSSGDSQGLDNYLIVSKDAISIPRMIKLLNGNIVYSIDPWNVDVNDDGMVLKLSLGGVAKKGGCLIHAEIDTCADNDLTNDLFKKVQSQIRKHFIKAHSGWWIGPDALDSYYNKLRFVAIGAYEPESADFRFNK